MINTEVGLYWLYETLSKLFNQGIIDSNGEYIGAQPDESEKIN